MFCSCACSHVLKAFARFSTACLCLSLRHRISPRCTVRFSSAKMFRMRSRRRLSARSMRCRYWFVGTSPLDNSGSTPWRQWSETPFGRGGSATTQQRTRLTTRDICYTLRRHHPPGSRSGSTACVSKPSIWMRGANCSSKAVANPRAAAVCRSRCIRPLNSPVFTLRTARISRSCDIPNRLASARTALNRAGYVVLRSPPAPCT